MELLSLAEDIHVKIEGASQNTDHDIRGYFEINKALHSIQAELVNNTPKINGD